MESSSQAFRDLPDEGIEWFVQSLNSLHESQLGVSMRAACGQRQSRPSTFPAARKTERYLSAPPTCDSSSC